MISCESAGITVSDHFAEVSKMIEIAKGAHREVQDYMLTRYAYGIKESRPLANFLPTLTIAAKSLATEMTNYNVAEKNMYGEEPITEEHVDNNLSVRSMLNKRGIKPENLKPAEDLRKLERRVKSENKKISDTNKLPVL